MIKTQYADYVDRIQTIVIAKGVNAKDLRSYLLKLPASTETDDKKRLQLLSDMKAKLKEAHEVIDIFDLLFEEYASFLDYNIFELILKKYGTGKELKALKYPEHLKAYIEKHKIKEFVKLYPELLNPKLQKLDNVSKELVIKFSVKRTQNLSTLKEVIGAVANILGIRPSTLRLCGVKKGCVLVTLLMPTSIADSLFTDSTVFSPEQECAFRAASVLWFECNGYKFDFRERSKKNQLQDSALGNT